VTEFALGDQQVQEIDATLATLAEIPDSIDLRFANHWSDDDERPALLAAALLGSLSAKKVRVDAVDEEAVDGLLRFGVATALARRSPHLTEFVGRTERLRTSQLRTLWSPASVGSTDALFAAAEPQDADSFGPFHATFVNPQLSTAADGCPDVIFLIRRWLNMRLLERGLSDAQAGPLVRALGLAVDEAVRNVREHAADQDHPSPNCLLRVSIGSPEQIRCSILDTGVGISRSLQQRKEVEPDLSPGERVAKLLAGEIPGWDAGRGTGLAYLTGEVMDRGGRCSVASGDVRVHGEGGEVTALEDKFELQGTVLDITLPIPGA
jgi:hypothetical protein